MKCLKEALGLAPKHRDRSMLLDQLCRTPLEQLEQTVARMKTRTPVAEVRRAYIDLLGVAPLEHFGVLREVYMKHLGQ